MIFAVETTGKSDRATCPICKETLPLDAPRVRQGQRAAGGLGIGQYHVLCFKGAGPLKKLKDTVGMGPYQLLLQLQEEERGKAIAH